MCRNALETIAFTLANLSTVQHYVFVSCYGHCNLDLCCGLSFIIYLFCMQRSTCINFGSVGFCIWIAWTLFLFSRSVVSLEILHFYFLLFFFSCFNFFSNFLFIFHFFFSFFFLFVRFLLFSFFHDECTFVDPVHFFPFHKKNACKNIQLKKVLIAIVRIKLKDAINLASTSTLTITFTLTLVMFIFSYRFHTIHSYIRALHWSRINHTWFELL